MTADGREALPGTLAALERGIAQGVYPGAQLYVSRRGAPVASFAVGAAGEGRPMTPDVLQPWLCCSKIALTVAFGLLWRRGLVEPGTRVADVVPEFDRGGKGELTFRHLLSHTAGLMPDPAYAAFGQGRAAMLRVVCEAELRPGVTPGELAYYSTLSAFFLVAEAIERLDGRPARRFVDEEVFALRGVRDTFHGLDPAAYAANEARLGTLHCHSTERGGLVPHPQLSRPEHFDRYQPGLDAIGPARDLGRVVEALLPDTTPQVLRPETSAALTARSRSGLYDVHFGSYIGWGLGLIVDGWAFGSFCSPDTFGHAGMRTSFALADPEHGLVVAAIANAMTPTPQAAIARDLRLVDAVYRDLGLDTRRAPPPRQPQPTPDELPEWAALAELEDRLWEID